MSPATEVPGTFRVNGSNKRMRELQLVFETPPKVSFYLSPLLYIYLLTSMASPSRLYPPSSTAKI